MKRILTAIGSFFKNPSPKTLIVIWTVIIILGAIPTYFFTWGKFKPYGLIDHIVACLIWLCIVAIPLLAVATLAKFVTLLCRRSPGRAFLNLFSGVLMFIIGFIVFAVISRFFG